jgi:phosphoglycerate dehydrogenase-like enzyme
MNGLVLFTGCILGSRVLSRHLSTSLMVRSLKIAVLGNGADVNGPLTMLKHLPSETCTVVAIGKDIAEWKSKRADFTSANALFVGTANGEILADVLREMPNLQWIQGIFAGLDHLKCEELTNNNGKYVVTNGKGVFSSSLAEWAMFGAAYFNKNIARFARNQKDHKWEQFTVGELRGKTMGIVGYGDIGQKTAVLAKAYGMKVLACRRRPVLSQGDTCCDEILGMEGMDSIFQRSDFIFVAAALTPKTEGMISKDTLLQAKDGQVFINVGRGKLVDEHALTEILQANAHTSDGLNNNDLPTAKGIRAAVLDVFSTEPLQISSPLWDLPNVFISSHNADMTEDFRHNSVMSFVNNCENWCYRGGAEALVNIVNAKEGY